jgi:5-methylcytosine-specific restriction endonuclease McrA
MIRVHRGEEPAQLAKLRSDKLDDLRTIIRRENRDPYGGEIHGYRIVAKSLWEAQLHKCCYCEKHIEHVGDDVEHYRPKGNANRGVHHPAAHGYWWLAFTWENLLFSCENCNRGKAKNIKFPLAEEGSPLVAEQVPHRYERPLLLDPAVECGVEHIEFRLVPATKKWTPFARRGSTRGDATIRTCLLDRGDLLDLYTTHVDSYVRPEVHEVRNALETQDAVTIGRAVYRANRSLLRRKRPFVGLSYDAIRHFVSSSEIALWGFAWHSTSADSMPIRGRSTKASVR